MAPRPTARTVLEGRHVLLTGATGGIGAHLGAAFVDAGARVSLVARDTGALEARAAALATRAPGQPPPQVLSADLTDPAQCASLVERAAAGLGPVDVLVNNAAVEQAATYAEQDPEVISETVATNLLATMLLSRLVLPSMLERRRGHLVHMSSVAGKSGSPFYAAYSASKFGMVGFSQALRAELWGTGVSSSVVCPGFVSDAGMFARYEAKGLVAPRALGVSSPARVVQGVLDALISDRAQVIVNPTPMRPAFALQELAPSLHARAAATLGVRAIMARMAALGR